MLAFLFPGQGSQEVGMGRDVWEASAPARAVFETADRVLGLPLSRICFEGPEEELVRTEIQQPALLTTSTALLRTLQARGDVAPAYVAGHSLGEYTALVASGALSFEEAVCLVQSRGRFMQEAVPPGRGAMAAVIGCPPEVVEQACESAQQETGGTVEPANYNAPQQTVVSGEAHAVDAACRIARASGARRTISLPVSAPFHCSLMRPAAEKLEAELSRVRFRDPAPPVITNVEASVNGVGGRVPELLCRQLTAAVRFTEMIRRLAELGVTRVLEVGPGRVLGGLVGRIDRRLARASLASMGELSSALEFTRTVTEGS